MERRKEVTLEQIALEMGVSIVTVSNALKGKKGISEELTVRGSMAFLKVISEDPEENTGDAIFFPGVEIDGILLIGDMSKDYAVKLKEIYQIPVVCAGSYDISKDIDYVAVDCFGGMEQVTELLLEAGHRNLLFVGSSMKSGNVIDCYLGYCKAMENGKSRNGSSILSDGNTHCLMTGSTWIW